jgi:trehalose/maltose hydrolase-like predicted phosphorylase
MTGSGLHLATLGGVWQALLLGFAGASVEAGALSLDPHLPGRWSSLRLRFRCLGQRVQVDITPSSAVVTASGPLSLRTPACAPARMAHDARLVHTDTGWVVQL